MPKRSLGEHIFDKLNVFFMLILIIVTIYPLSYVLLASLSDPMSFMAHQGLLLKSYGLTLSSYVEVFKNPNITSGYLNTIFVVVVGTILNVYMTAFGAYFLSRKNVLWKNAVMIMAVFTMFFSGGLIPFYLTVRQLHLHDTLWSLIIPVAVNTFNLIILRTAFLGVPDEMEESAKLDGAGHFRILFRIMMPIAAPTIAVIVLYYGVAHWNSWFHAMIFLQKRELYPLQLILREILILNDTTNMTGTASTGEHEFLGLTIKYAVVIVATLPILLLYPFLQKYFAKGVMVGALKG
ncbi:MAG: carbohydrate ABC transporter permease [Bacteroidota bacterium]